MPPERIADAPLQAKPSDSLPTLSDPSANAPLPRVLWPLLFGNFVIGTGVMVVPGTLNDISSNLQVSVPVAGQLITAAAVVMCIGAPLCATLVAGWDRRRLLTLALLWYGVFLLASACMPDFGSLMAVRVLAAIAPAIFTPQAASCINLLVTPAQRGRAITFVFMGWSVASVVGTPLGAWVGGTLGWRVAFGSIALLSLISAAWVWRSMPDSVRPPALSRAAWGQTLRSPASMLCVAVTVLFAAGQFVLFSYFAPYFKQQLQFSPQQLSLLFAWYGFFGFTGNMLMSRNIDRTGAPRAVMWSVGAMALSLLLWPLATNVWLAALITLPWGLGCFASNSAQQARLAGIAPTLASASIAINSSAMYAGQAMGAASGGWLIAQGRMLDLHWFGLAAMLAALLVSWWASRQTVDVALARG
jgi:predicted MFS family arabinose efflux permease